MEAKPRKESGRCDVEAHIPEAGTLEFRIELAIHHTCQSAFKEKAKKFAEDSENALPLLGALRMDSRQSTGRPSQTRTPEKRPVYIPDSRLGGGAFGDIYEIIGASTGSV